MDTIHTNFDVVRQLLDGSAEIDRMRLEIDRFVWMIIGLAEKDPTFYDLNKLVGLTSKSGYRWSIFKTGFGQSPRHTVTCVFSNFRVYDSVHFWVPIIKLEHVQGVYESLYVFLNLVTSICPTLNDRLKSLLDAAKEKK